MMLACYRFITKIATPAVRLWLKRRLQQGKEDKDRFDERFGHAVRMRPIGPLIWIHGASVGESISALPLIEQLIALPSKPTVLVTTGTVTSAALMAERLPKNAFHQFVPVDLPDAVERFLDHWQPDIAVWIESEFWPNLLMNVQRRGIPAILLNGRMSKRSFSSWRRYRSAIEKILSTFAVRFAQTEADGERLRELGAGEVKFAGDLKWAAAPLPVDGENLSRLRGVIANRPIWLVASTHDGEELLIADAHQELRQNHPDILTILVPRHPNRGDELVAQLTERKLSVCQRSQRQYPDIATDIYLADTLGELGLFYRLSEIVFVGGSLVAHGGHNPLEPAKLDCAILTGPHIFNFEEIVATLQAQQAIVTASDASELAKLVSGLLQNDSEVRRLAAAALACADAGDRVVGQAIQTIVQLVPDLSVPAGEEGPL